jgi:HSP20 family protein
MESDAPNLFACYPLPTGSGQELPHHAPGLGPIFGTANAISNAVVATAILAVGGTVSAMSAVRPAMARDLERFVAHSLQSASDAFQETCWRPAADIYQTAEGWLIKFDLAGVSPSEIELEVRGRTLTLSGVRRDWSIAECRHAYSMEIHYNRFGRTIQLPCDLEQTQTRTEYRDGMLLVRLITRGGT